MSFINAGIFARYILEKNAKAQKSKIDINEY
jgi:hypothetical protein